MERQVRTQKKCKLTMGTHQLESPDRETSQDMERMQASEGHSRSREPDRETNQDMPVERLQASKSTHQLSPDRDKSGHGKNASQQGDLTFWRAQIERQVRKWKECEPARGTYMLESPDGETSQDTERVQASKGHWHSQTGEPRQRDKSGHGKNVNQQGALTCWRA